MKPGWEPADPSEKLLQAYEKMDEGLRRGETYAGAPRSCDICGQSFSSRQMDRPRF